MVYSILPSHLVFGVKLVLYCSLTWTGKMPHELATLVEQLSQALAKKSKKMTAKVIDAQIQVSQSVSLQMKQLSPKPNFTHSLGPP
jgi:hypothetical protein